MMHFFQLKQLIFVGVNWIYERMEYGHDAVQCSDHESITYLGRPSDFIYDTWTYHTLLWSHQTSILYLVDNWGPLLYGACNTPQTERSVWNNWKHKSSDHVTHCPSSRLQFLPSRDKVNCAFWYQFLVVLQSPCPMEIKKTQTPNVKDTDSEWLC